MTPLVSVVIPTIGRRRMLIRAVESAVGGMQAGECEVIVVPNGPDRSWKDTLSEFSANADIKILPIEKAHASAARNHGLRAATGRYVRFLDDDDYLYPDDCRTQYEMLENSGADICSGAFDIVDADGNYRSQGYQPGPDDIVEAMLSPTRRTQPVMHVFRRSILDGLQWRESLPYLQDIAWLLDICAHAERHWIKLGHPVGAWCNHPGGRISPNVPINEKQKRLAALMKETIDKLESAGRMTPSRRRFAAIALWTCIHTAFYLDPLYWSRFAREVTALFPGSRPAIALYNMRALRGANPIVVESLALPVRWLKHLAGLTRT